MRLHELAKELDADSKRLLAIAKELGLGVKSHSSNLPSGTEGILRAAWAEEAAEEAAEAETSELSVSVTVNVGKTGKEPAPEPEPVVEETPVAEEPVAEEAPAAAAEEPVAEEAPADDAAPAEPVVEEAPAEAEAASDETAEVAEPVAAEAPADEEAAEPVEDAPADTPAPAEPVAESDDAGGSNVVVTFGGQPQRHDEPEPAPAAPADAAAKKSDDAGNKEVVQRGRVNVPTSRERKGAKILGRIDLKPADVQRPERNQPAYDPLDPTRAMPARTRPGEGGGKEGKDDRKPKSGRPGKGGDGQFVFDPEDNTTLSAIRLHGFANRRRPPPRRPPMRRSRGGPRRARKPIVRPTHPVTVRSPIGVRELSEELGIKAREIISYFPEMDPRNKNVVLDHEQLEELAVHLDREITVLAAETAEARLLSAEDERRAKAATEEKPRPPVVAVMGHVDHGKTSLLDALRKSRLTSKEAGGITQRTSAYHVKTASGAEVTMVDTPGHKAFTEMRARGASVTDVAVLVVAADDGVMEQTQEAIDHANAAGVPMVVAINKIDKNNADVMKVRQQLASANVLVEDYGGEIGVVECSATTGAGLEALVERLALETELLELAADPAVPARGVVIDSRKDSKHGVVATVIVQEGTLRAKDALLAGKVVGRVRWLLDDKGKRVTEAGPSMPVQVVGFEEPPEAGARVICVGDLNAARDVVVERTEADKVVPDSPLDTVNLDNLFEQIAAQNVTEINVILKSDNMSSMEVLRRTVEEVTHDEVRFKVIRTGVGDITEDDVLLAAASEAFIIGFAVDANPRAKSELQRTGVELKTYDIIYEMTEDLEAALEGELGTESVEEVIGHALVRATFKSSRLGLIAGCYVTDGIVQRDAHVRVKRGNDVIYTGRIDSLKRFKDDVKEVRENYECGIHLKGFDDSREEDVFEVFTVTEVKRTLESSAKAPESSEG